ncbi:hypothetical protein FNF28_02248 [Cafeteria roenbergensis]|uniref:Uncharacterized protein n=1 Tax=Cafeteria roenbergensis TaxID=33653 RepID=A0A5A8DXA0_CAFRO|nr:hypothetical protein FNF28_02248 [Cafeteria roenbergensis]
MGESGWAQPADLVQAAAACEPGGCGAFGHCWEGMCLCQRYYLGDKCQVDFVQESGTAPWTAMVVITAAVHIVCVLIALWRLVWRWLRTKALCPAWGARDTAAWLNTGGSLLRLLWLTNVSSTWTIGARAVDGLLLRLPQSAWLSAYCFVILVWREITAASGGRPPEKWHVTAVWVASGFMTLSTSAIAVVDAAEAGGFGGRTALRVAGDIAFAAFVAVLAITGARAASRLRDLALSMASDVRAIPSYDDRIRALMVLRRLREAFQMTIVSVSTAGILVLCVGIVVAAGTSPDGDPQAYLAYMYVVHCIAEPSAAVVLLVVTQQGELPPAGSRPPRRSTRTSSVASQLSGRQLLPSERTALLAQAPRPAASSATRAPPLPV